MFMRCAHRTVAALLLTIVLAIGAMAGVARAQVPAPPSGLLKVYLDCYECDEEFLRQNILFVEYVRDRAVADVHVLVTTRTTGSGGLEWTMKVIGLGRFQDVDRPFIFTTPQAATPDDKRREFARVFKIGVAAYSADTAAARDLDVTLTPAPVTSAAPAHDPWDSWVFRVSLNTSLQGEEATSYRSARGSVSASRVTDNWKLNITFSSNTDENRYEVTDRTIRSHSASSDFNGLIVKSLGPKWSAGARAGTSRSTFSNIGRAVTAAPGIEFDFFPYAESNRRSLTINYSVGATRYRYAELTIYDKFEEVVPTHTINASLGLRQPWGSLGIYSSLRQQLTDFSRHRTILFGNTDLRLFKGFSFNMFAEYDLIHDQIGLPKQGASEDEILLRLQQLSTSYSYFISVGVSYSFGSIFNSVVNPRFNGLNIF
jgi:hypothetical protein